MSQDNSSGNNDQPRTASPPTADQAHQGPLVPVAVRTNSSAFNKYVRPVNEQGISNDASVGNPQQQLLASLGISAAQSPQQADSVNLPAAASLSLLQALQVLLSNGQANGQQDGGAVIAKQPDNLLASDTLQMLATSSQLAPKLSILSALQQRGSEMQKLQDASRLALAQQLQQQTGSDTRAASSSPPPPSSAPSPVASQPQDSKSDKSAPEVEMQQAFADFNNNSGPAEDDQKTTSDELGNGGAAPQESDVEDGDDADSPAHSGPSDKPFMEIAIDSDNDKGCQVCFPPLVPLHAVKQQQQEQQQVVRSVPQSPPKPAAVTGLKRKEHPDTYASGGSGGSGPTNNGAGACSAGNSGMQGGNVADAGEDEDGYNGGGAARNGGKRARLIWTPEMHARFVECVNQLGVKNAVPKTILRMLNIEGMTRENVASHLQKYRLYLKNRGHRDHRNEHAPAAAAPQPRHLEQQQQQLPLGALGGLNGLLAGVGAGPQVSLAPASAAATSAPMEYAPAALAVQGLLSRLSALAPAAPAPAPQPMGINLGSLNASQLLSLLPPGTNLLALNQLAGAGQLGGTQLLSLANLIPGMGGNANASSIVSSLALKAGLRQ